MGSFQAGSGIAAASAVLMAGAAAGVLAPPALEAVELRGSSHFTRPPWRAELVSYRTNAGDPRAAYFFTVELDPDAGAALAALVFRQSSGPDRIAPFSLERTEAFLGRPRRRDTALAAQAEWLEAERAVRVRFEPPVEPGSTLTVRLRPWRNPSVPGTYQFQVTAFPAGPNPSPAPLGTSRLRIYRPDWR